MPTSERESALARRLRELEEEERRLRQSMKQINRQLRRLERGAPEVFDARAVAPPPSAPPPQTAPPARRPDPTEDKRFANYFASGSFVTTRPLGRERRVQRNKAIFLLIFALLMGYLVYHLIF
jgi:hypothetical protein